MGDQQPNRQIDIQGDGNVVGDHSQSHVVKAEIAGDVADSTVITAGRDATIRQKIIHIFTGDIDAERARRDRSLNQ